MRRAVLRRFRPVDRTAVRALVESVLKEYGLWREHRRGFDDLRDIPAAYLRTGGEFVVAIDGRRLIGCGGLMPLAGKLAAVQRMYLVRRARGRGLGKAILSRLEDTARRGGFERLILETSPRFQDAIGLYLRSGYDACVLDEDCCCNIVMLKGF